MRAQLHNNKGMNTNSMKSFYSNYYMYSANVCSPLCRFLQNSSFNMSGSNNEGVTYWVASFSWDIFNLRAFTRFFHFYWIITYEHAVYLHLVTFSTNILLSTPQIKYQPQFYNKINTFSWKYVKKDKPTSLHGGYGSCVITVGKVYVYSLKMFPAELLQCFMHFSNRQITTEDILIELT